MYKRKQKGVSLILILIFILIVGFGGIFGVKVMFPYMDVMTVEKQAVQVLEESKSTELTDAEVKRKLMNRMVTQNVKIEYDSIELVKNGGQLTGIQIDMVSELPLWKNAYLILELEATAGEKEKE